MHGRKSLFALALTIGASLPPAAGQTAVGPPADPAPGAAAAATPIPALVPYSGAVVSSDGKPQTGDAGITFLIFKDAKGGEPLWTETQTVTCNANGHYEVYLGAASGSGLPLDLFTTGEARWLEVQIAGQTPQPRVLLASVPYAMKAADAVTLGGLPASAYALAGPAAATATPAVSPDATASTVTTPGGTSGYLAVYSGATTIDDSLLFESGTRIGIDTKTPAATLDVNGTIDARGAVTMEAAGTASASAGQVSQPIDFFTSAYNSSTKKVVAPLFTLRAEPAGNNTSAPSGSLNLLYGNGAAPSETGLAIGATGIIKFASGQTFPGTGAGTIIGVTTTSPLSGSGTSGSVALSLNLTALETTLNGKYAQLGAANKFTSPITFATGQTFPGAGTITGVTAGTGLTGGGTSGAIKLSLDTTKIPTLTSSPTFSGSAGDGVVGDTAGTTVGTAGVEGTAGSGNTSGFSGIAGVWGNASAHVGVLGTSDQYASVQGLSNKGTGVQGVSSSSYGVEGTSTSAPGVLGYTGGGTLNTGGVVGQAGGTSGFGGIAGVWGDAYSHVGALGTSYQYAGVEGISKTGQGVLGTSTSGTGVQGVSSSSYGVEGTSTSAPGVLGYTGGGTLNTGGVVGQAGATSGFSGIAGVWGDASAHVGVFGSSSQYPGVQGSSVSAQGVQGSSTSGNGVHGVSQSTSGIFGETSSTSAADAAVYGSSNGNAMGVYGFSTKIGIHGVSGGGSVIGTLSPYTFNNGPPAIWGDTNSSGYGIVGTADKGMAGEFINESSTRSTIYVSNDYENDSSGDPIYGDVAEFAGGGGSCEFFGNGDVTCTGTVSSDNAVDKGARAVQTYSVQSAESWYEDAGSGQLVDGVAHVALDPTFGQIVNASVEYHVFLTPGGDSDGLYVSNKTPRGFDVHEQHGGRANISFDYRIMAKRVGHEKERLADVTAHLHKQAGTRAGMRPSSEQP